MNIDHSTSLSQYICKKTILIDDAGWGDLVLGVIIGALRLPEHKYMERRIPVSAFQSPNFEKRIYLDGAARIAQELVEVMKPDKETCFKICSGFVLTPIQKYLRSKRFFVEKVKISGELQEKVEKSFTNWCVEAGVPRRALAKEAHKRFFAILEWVAEEIELREGLVKTGWKSWQEKWRNEAHRLHLQKIAESRKRYFQVPTDEKK